MVNHAHLDRKTLFPQTDKVPTMPFIEGKIQYEKVVTCELFSYSLLSSVLSR